MKNSRRNRLVGFRKLIVALSFILPSVFSIFQAHAALLLEVDLSVENTISISASDGESLISASGSDFTGIYLDNFFGVNSLGLLNDSLISGNLTSANESSNLTPDLFHFSNDPGLNIFEVSSAANLSFTEGVTAFVGSATWSIGSSFYQHFLANASSGNIFFPADSADDRNNAFILGSWAVLRPEGVDVPEPSVFALFALGLGFVGFARARAS